MKCWFLIFFCTNMFCVRTERTNRLIVCFKSGFGDLEATQYLRFRPSNKPTFSGGCLVEQRLWKARFVGWFLIRRWSLFLMARLKFLVRLLLGSAWKP